MLPDLTSWWQALPAGEQLFWGIGLVSNAFFLIYLLLQFIGHETDLSIDHDDADFTVLSIRSILAFGMFLGYTGLITLRAGLGLPAALAAGVFAGLLAAWLAYKLIRFLLRMQSSGTLNLKNAVGTTGTVHLPIPAFSADTGKVMVNVQGALRELEAISEGAAIPTGTPILVTEVNENDVLIVIPYQP